MLFTVPAGIYSLLLVGSGLAGQPDDGTAYLGTLLNTTVAVNSLSGTPFNFISFDVAQFQGLLTPHILQAVGLRQDGTAVTNAFTGVGGSFQTLQLGSGFVNLNTVRLTGGFAFDNLVVGIPEPSTGTLALFGTLCLLGQRGMRRTGA